MKAFATLSFAISWVLRRTLSGTKFSFRDKRPFNGHGKLYLHFTFHTQKKPKTT